MKHYIGKRGPDGLCSIAVVTAASERSLNPRIDLANHSTTFEWSRPDNPMPGAAQAALAILADALEDERRALSLYQDFKWRVLTPAHHNGWTLSHEDILAIVTEMESEYAA